MIWSVYFIRCASVDSPIKIGRALNPAARLVDLQVANPYQLELVAAFACGRALEASRVENMIHRRLARFQLRGEWFGAEVAEHVDRVIELLRDRPRGMAVRDVLTAYEWAPNETPAPLASRRAKGLDAARASIASKRRAAFRAALCQRAANSGR